MFTTKGNIYIVRGFFVHILLTCLAPFLYLRAIQTVMSKESYIIKIVKFLLALERFINKNCMI